MVKAWLLILTLAFAFFLNFDANAQTKKPTVEACWKKSVTQLDMAICANLEFKINTEDMNSSYKTLFDKTSIESRPKLELAFKAWQDYQKLQCSYESFYTGNGSESKMNYFLCLSQLVLSYKKSLDRLLNCQEGDVSCTIP